MLMYALTYSVQVDYVHYSDQPIDIIEGYNCGALIRITPIRVDTITSFKIIFCLDGVCNNKLTILAASSLHKNFNRLRKKDEMYRNSNKFFYF